MERRDLLRVLTAALAAGAPAATAAEYQPRYFSQAEYAMVDAVCEIILPADAESGGAHEARVAFYIDTVLLHGSRGNQEAWRKGLLRIDKAAVERFDRGFAELSPAEREQMVAAIAAAEFLPGDELGRFFGRLKSLAIEAYWYSDVGLKHFGYKGNGGRLEFPGCTHPEHQG